MVIRITIGNQRGGVGKTTTAVTIARLWADRGVKTLLVDADPQGSIGSILKVKPDLFLNDFLWNKRRLLDCVVTPRPNLDILCSNRDTLEAEQRAIAAIGRERIFENVFHPIEDLYDAILIDVGPSLSLMQICALVYTTDFLIPVSMDRLSVTGATGIFDTVEQLQVQIAKTSRCIGLLPTIVDQRYQNTDIVMGLLQKVAEHFSAPVLHAIRTDATVSKAIRTRQFIADVDPRCRCYEDYAVVSEQILQSYGFPSVEATEGEKDEQGQTTQAAG